MRFENYTHYKSLHFLKEAYAAFTYFSGLLEAEFNTKFPQSTPTVIPCRDYYRRLTGLPTFAQTFHQSMFYAPHSIPLRSTAE